MKGILALLGRIIRSSPLKSIKDRQANTLFLIGSLKLSPKQGEISTSFTPFLSPIKTWNLNGTRTLSRRLRRLKSLCSYQNRMFLCPCESGSYEAGEIKQPPATQQTRHHQRRFKAHTAPLETPRHFFSCQEELRAAYEPHRSKFAPLNGKGLLATLPHGE